jgi:hypothetical protein
MPCTDKDATNDCGNPNGRRRAWEREEEECECERENEKEEK